MSANLNRQASETEKVSLNQALKWRKNSVASSGRFSGVLSTKGRLTSTYTRTTKSLFLVASVASDLEVIKPFPVLIEATDDGFIASFEPANINASGDNWNEALSNMKDLIAGLFRLLESHPPERLGPSPRRQLLVLRSFLRNAK